MGQLKKKKPKRGEMPPARLHEREAASEKTSTESLSTKRNKGKPLLTIAREYNEAKLSTLPVKVDGSKGPNTKSWKSFQNQRPTKAELEHFYGNGQANGIGIIAGKVSGNLEFMDFDDEKTYEKWEPLVPKSLQKRLTVHKSPNGFHVAYRCKKIEGSQKLAKDISGEVLIETRGEGAYVVAPGSPLECHETGKPYVHYSGPPITKVSTITPEERDTLLDLARSFNEQIEVENGPAPERRTKDSTDDESPGDWFNRTNTKQDLVALLESHGWKKVHTRVDGTIYVRRPGKSKGSPSATVGYKEAESGIVQFYPFSSNADPFDSDKSYSPFAVYAILKHGGDFPKATKELAAKRSGSLPQNSLISLNSLGGHKWPKPDPIIFHGPAGAVAQGLDPYTEADPIIVLAHTLSGFGCMVGLGPHYQVTHDIHGTKINIIAVGDTAKGRKGTGFSSVKEVLSYVNPDFIKHNIISGLSTGEGLIKYLSLDVPASEKTYLVMESEFGATLTAANRDTNTLTGTLRQAYDGDTLNVLTRADPLTVRLVHLAINAHITRDELCKKTTEVNMVNGFINRFIFLGVTRSKLLYNGAIPPEKLMRQLAKPLIDAYKFARKIKRVERDSEAQALWNSVYETLSSGYPGLIGAVLSRAEAHVLRLSLVYALLDQSSVIKEVHLRAALALWSYSEQCTRIIFGNSTGDPLADRINAFLQNEPKTKTEISNQLGRNEDAKTIQAALDLLVDSEMATTSKVKRNGRTTTAWGPVTKTTKSTKTTT